MYNKRLLLQAAQKTIKVCHKNVHKRNISIKNATSSYCSFRKGTKEDEQVESTEQVVEKTIDILPEENTKESMANVEFTRCVDSIKEIADVLFASL